MYEEVTFDCTQSQDSVIIVDRFNEQVEDMFAHIDARIDAAMDRLHEERFRAATDRYEQLVQHSREPEKKPMPRFV